MLWTMFQNGRSRIRLLVWLVRASAITLIGVIGLLQFVLGNGFHVASLAPSFLSANLNFGRDEHGRFEFSLAMQPGRAKAAEEVSPGRSKPPDAAGSEAAIVATRPQAPIVAIRAEAPATNGAAASAASLVSVPAPPEKVVPSDSGLTEKTVTCALPSPPKQSAGDGRLMLVSFATDDGRVDGYGVNDTAFTPDADKLAGYTLPVLKWVRNQGALSGYRHAELRKAAAPRALPLPNVMRTASDEGAGDYVMSVAHGAVDFLAVGSGDFASELNLWYHSLNAGFRTQIMSETPCRNAEPPVMNGARSNIQPISISENRRAMMSGNLFVGDGHTAIKDFKVNGHRPAGEVGSEVRLGASGSVAVSALLSAKLDKAAPAAPSRTGWSLEQARIGDSQLVSVEVIVNGEVAASKIITADGREQPLDFKVQLQQSSWVAIRIKGAAHSNPVFVLVDNMPVRGSRASVDWILRSLLEVYQTTNTRWSPSQSATARSAYEYSYAVYQKIRSETSAP